MKSSEFIDEILREVSIDPRIKNGTIDLNNPQHTRVIEEHIAERVDTEFARALMASLNKTTLQEGNFPERQAYNEDGILVTFPDAESKKAAIERGTHFENAPSGAEDKSEGGDETDDTEEEEPESIFTDYERPEDEIETNSDIEDVDGEMYGLSSRDGNVDGETHHIYDILAGIKQSLEDDTMENQSVEEKVLSGELHPSILFALKQKWEYDKSGHWFDENGKLRASTDRRGHLDPSKSDDRQEMLIWLDDYQKRHGND